MIKRVQDLGVPAYDELVVIARRDFVAEEPKLVREFLSAVDRGVAAEVEDPEAAVKLIEESFESSPNQARRGREQVLPANCSSASESGSIDPDQVQGLVDWMYEKGLIERKWSASELLVEP